MLTRRFPRLFALIALLVSAVTLGGVATAAKATDITTAPNYTISGGSTGLVDPVFSTRDASGGTYVSSPNNNWVRYFAPGISGNVQPTRVISGAATTINVPYNMAVDSNGLLYVANMNNTNILVFSATADGNVAPLYSWSVPSTPRSIAFDPATGHLGVASDDRYLRFYSNVASNAPTLERTLNMSATLVYAQSLAFSAAGDFYVSGFNAFVAHWPANASGTTAPDRIISGANTQFDFVWAVQVQPVTNDLYVSSDGNLDAILVFPSTANGNVIPRDRYTGGSTGLVANSGLALDCNNFNVVDRQGVVSNFTTITSVSCPTQSPSSSGSASAAALAATGTDRSAELGMIGLGVAAGLLGTAALVPVIRRRKA